ncbi:MAG: hypothetical protein AVDCRST_MAG37-1645 [uncultured Rubrobacteraceae bacterium]|uniref:Uncharacterized protein n=1 Tax=uncultured Rubrobacteraceae bacterium TaxID=349277 RepID=A0A6J4QG77_9ACTN|nr:MAG: hypothetical protein AVDCRST_MAG37-1645 [uncultured Rubrobacteraceae bacterium]
MATPVLVVQEHLLYLLMLFVPVTVLNSDTPVREANRLPDPDNRVRTGCPDPDASYVDESAYGPVYVKPCPLASPPAPSRLAS